MNKISVTGIVNSYHVFDREFWLAYKTLEKLLSKEDFDSIKLQLMKSKKIPHNILEKVGLETYEIELQLLDVEWKNKNNQAKEEGIAIHKQISDMFQSDLKEVKINLGVDTDLYQVKKTEEFLNCDCGIFPEFKMEIPLEDDYYLVGIADLIIKNGNSVTIIDWKNTDKIDFKSRYDVSKKKSKFMKYPLCKLMDVNGVHYQLQLSLYGYMLQKLDPTINIECLKIIQIKDGKIRKEHIVDYLQDVIDKLLKWHVKHMQLHCKTKECKLIDYEKY